MLSNHTFDPEMVRRLEIKMLPSAKGRDKTQSPKAALTKEECLIYADYLERTGQPAAAAFFRK